MCVCVRLLYLLCGSDKHKAPVHTLLCRPSEGVQRLCVSGSWETASGQGGELSVCKEATSELLAEFFPRVSRTRPKLPVSVLVRLHQQPNKGEQFVPVQAKYQPSINFPDKSAFSASNPPLASVFKLWLMGFLFLSPTIFASS